MLLPLLANLDFAGGGSPAPTPTPSTVDKGRDAGSGKGRREPQEPWWTGEWITPGVDAYLPEKPPEDVSPLRPKAEDARKRLTKVREALPDTTDDYRDLSQKLSTVTQAIGRLEKQAEKAVEARRLDRAIGRVTQRYRTLARQMAEIEMAIIAHEEAMHRQRLMREDDEFLNLLLEII